MAVIKTFQCDMCFNPRIAGGSITLVLTQDTAEKYKITRREPVLIDPPLKSNQMTRHVCADCVDIIGNEAFQFTKPRIEEE